MTMSNDEAVAMIEARRAERDCNNCANQADWDEELCGICMSTADKYYYEEKVDETSD